MALPCPSKAQLLKGSAQITTRSWCGNQAPSLDAQRVEQKLAVTMAISGFASMGLGEMQQVTSRTTCKRPNSASRHAVAALKMFLLLPERDDTQSWQHAQE